MIVTKRSTDRKAIILVGLTRVHAVRLLNEDDDVLPVDRNVEYRYLRYETY